MAAELGIELIVHINQEGLERGINPFDSRLRRSTPT